MRIGSWSAAVQVDLTSITHTYIKGVQGIIKPEDDATHRTVENC